MSEADNPHLPFTRGRKVGSGETRDIYDHPEGSVVTKIYKEKDATPQNYTEVELDDLIQQVGADKAQIEFVRNELVQRGGHAETVPESGFAIHQSSHGGLTFSEAQGKVTGKTLQENSGAVWNLPGESLDELIHIFELNNNLLQKGQALDIVGGTDKQGSNTSKAIARLLPLFFSRNIMIDDNQNVKYVDPKVFTRDYLQSPESGGAVNKIISRIGSETSVLFLKALRLFK
ncbi:hypothetical protein IPM65_00790 [Candidatus Roizmanbacteria bacterium]|nr:MAG: hypothetical protein IPM65_00790 [Candidatus Roizmanbacteria bacterium]